ncbi:R3H domain-containing protein 4-like [Ornithodoros turicata]|uniref:R3H domain-containing protein 4-like n=1 Tax=Ornithodoros turicata TaxID=34597 RepID=UPI0031391A28
MGVIKNLACLPDPFADPVEDAFDQFIADVEQGQPLQILEVVAAAERSPRQRKNRQRTNSTRVDVVGLTSRGKHKSGSKKCRRLENAHYLQSLAEPEDVAEVSIYDFVHESVSAFAQLLCERENMQVWNDFISCSEEEQQRIVDEGCGNEEMQESSEAEGADKRGDHPAFSAEESFHRLDSDLRKLLRKQKIPLGKLSQLEEEVSGFFKSHPRSEYRNSLCSSFERLMMHALCQYMNLISKSYDADGVRWTKVWNRRPVFVPPAVMLSSYLECRCARHVRRQSS